MSAAASKFLRLAAICLAAYVMIHNLLPLLLPFLLGALLALAADPLVRLLCQRFRLPRGIATCIGISTAFCLLLALVIALCALALRQLRTLSGILPDLEDSIRSGMESLSGWLLNLTADAPAGIRSTLSQNITTFFSDSSVLLDRIMAYFLRLASGVLSQIPDGFLGVGTAILSSFMISAKLPTIRAFFRTQVCAQKVAPVFSVLQRLKSALGGWLRAQLTLSLVTFTVLLLGFLLLHIAHAPIWAILVALVDAFPILGVGTALVPWSLVSFLQGNRIRAFALLGIYAVAAVGRSILEPKLVGRQLGLDPLVTLLSLYLGYRLFGFPGMVLSPIFSVIIAHLLEFGAEKSP